MKQLIIIRGLPGSGKSKLSAAVADTCISEDDYFSLCTGGGYRFDPGQRYEAIGWMIDQTIRRMREGVSRIAVATCALNLGELSGIKMEADRLGYTTFTVLLQNSHGHQSVHDVSEPDYECMRANMSTTLDMSRDPENVWRGKDK